MPSVRVEDDAFGDLRFDDLADAAGLADGDHARGKMERLWRQCTHERTYVLSETNVTKVLGPRGVDAIIFARLGERVSGGIRICGTRGRIEWLEKLRKNGRKGGRPPVTKRKPSGSGDSNPPAPAPAPAPAQKKEKEPGKPGAPSPADELASVACEAINAAMGTSYRPTTEATLRLCRSLAKSKRTPDDVRRVIAAKVAEWKTGDPKTEAWLCPDTLLGASNFAKYLVKLDEGTPDGAVDLFSQRRRLDA